MSRAAEPPLHPHPVIPECGPPDTCELPETSEDASRVDWDCLDAQQALVCADGTCRCFVNGEPVDDDGRPFRVDPPLASVCADDGCWARLANRACGWAIPEGGDAGAPRPIRDGGAAPAPDAGASDAGG